MKFNFNRKVLAKEHLHDSLLNSITSNLAKYGDILVINQCILLREPEFDVEYIINTRTYFKEHWEFSSVNFHIIQVGKINELDYKGKA